MNEIPCFSKVFEVVESTVEPILSFPELVERNKSQFTLYPSRSKQKYK